MLDDTQQEQEAPPISNEAAGVGLGITDLRVFKEVIDVASARGAFKAGEFSTIGDVYGRLSTFLAAIDQANAPAEDEAIEEDADTDTSEEDADTDTSEEDSTEEE